VIHAAIKQSIAAINHIRRISELVLVPLNVVHELMHAAAAFARAIMNEMACDLCDIVEHFKNQTIACGPASSGWRNGWCAPIRMQAAPAVSSFLTISARWHLISAWRQFVAQPRLARLRRRVGARSPRLGQRSSSARRARTDGPCGSVRDLREPGPVVGASLNFRASFGSPSNQTIAVDLINP
jgi:hypothetical protein